MGLGKLLIIGVIGVVLVAVFAPELLTAGALLWVDGLMDSGQQDEKMQNTEVSIQSVTCDADRNQVDLVFANTGEETVPVQHVRVSARRTDNKLVDSTTVDWSGAAFRTPGDTGTQTVALQLSGGTRYHINVEFRNGYSTSETCQAQ